MMGYEDRVVGNGLVFGSALLASAIMLTSTSAYASDQDSSKQPPSSVGSEKKSDKSEIDPYENFNRAMFNFNDKLDDYVAKPISSAYLWAAPGFFKQGVSNFFSNLKDINVVLNDHMQGKFQQGTEDTGRFLTNSTVGLLGLFDVASEFGLNKHEEDFGQTLAVWGVPQGSYLVLPVLGPTTARGLPAGVLDVAANPSTYVGMPVQLVSMLNTRANAEGALKFIDEAAIDPYVFTREAYLQNQQHLISDGKVSASANVLPLEDELFDQPDDHASTTSSNHKTENDGDKPVSTAASQSLDNATVALDNANSSFEKSLEKLETLSKAQQAKSKKHKVKKTDTSVE